MSDVSERIKRVRELDEAAREGPWGWTIEDASMMVLKGPRHEDGYGPQSVLSVTRCRSCRKREGVEAWKRKEGTCSAGRPADHSFIAESRTLLPALADDAERLEAENARLMAVAARVSDLFAAMDYVLGKVWRDNTLTGGGDEVNAAWVALAAALDEHEAQLGVSPVSSLPPVTEEGEAAAEEFMANRVVRKPSVSPAIEEGGDAMTWTKEFGFHIGRTPGFRAKVWKFPSGWVAHVNGPGNVTADVRRLESEAEAKRFCGVVVGMLRENDSADD